MHQPKFWSTVPFVAIMAVLVLMTVASVMFATTTYTFTVGDVAYVAVVAQSDCQYITVYEDAQAGTTDILLKAPLSSSPIVTRPAGQRIVLVGAYPRGTVAGYIKTDSGTITVAQEEY